MSHSLSETNTVFINKIFKKLQQNEIDNVDFFLLHVISYILQKLIFKALIMKGTQEQDIEF